MDDSDFEKWFVGSQLTENLKPACWAAWQACEALQQKRHDLQEMAANCRIGSPEYNKIVEAMQ